MKQMPKIKKLISDCRLHFSHLGRLVLQAMRRPYRMRRLRIVLGSVISGLQKSLYEHPIPQSGQMERLKTLTQGLHSLLPHDSRFSYSILMPVYHPKPDYFQLALESALQQSAPHMELLVGFDGVQPKEVYAVAHELQKSYPDKLRLIQLDRTKEKGGISATTNLLAAQARGNFLLLMDHDDWIRPDLLYRYEQTLRLLDCPEQGVLYCNEYKINEQSQPIPHSESKKPNRPPFPYLFVNYICHCLLIPKALWEKVGGERSQYDGAQDYDLVLRLDLAGASFYNVPVYLYAWRVHAQSTAGDVMHKPYVLNAGLTAMRDYVRQKGLNWQIEHGEIPTTFRAIPHLPSTPTVHVIIPYRDQKILTLSAVNHVLKQRGVHVKITAVDNNSKDSTIAEELQKLGVEWLPISEPFNYSRLNNLAVQRSQIGASCDLLLFLNNDVDLREDAVEELCRWIHEPQVGMVGCQLLYPHGNLQHGGVEVDEKMGIEQMGWRHGEQGVPLSFLGKSRVIRVVDAVTAACALVKKENFVQVGGFDEVWYPVAYSDTNLASKLKARGLFCLYTPYAVGIHHESVSRQLGNVEDYEESRWLHEQVMQRGRK